MENNPSCINHISLGTNDFDKAAAFYDVVLATIGVKRIVSHPGAVAYGKEFPEFWLGVPHDGEVATVGNGTHVGFMAASKEDVDAFHAAALEAGAVDDGAPGPREEYGEAYYGGFVRDLDGHKIEASYVDMEIIARDYGVSASQNNS
jgi:catechol 2,3-dioxygenase-like lactoylglutathione lyase family enzyme